ncbi:hypothetical protein [Cellulomonas sp. Leaf334]|uniref:hypothetical protein n=1 Tax=Cellulomonas sp. Leaf334 TaxID=1736339 RepID=UPI0007019D07|nr:hypothetical protein [Cellulomonas sp. Leaf334]KQR17313.1 hypothetical protein ASF78_08485 [Cellulomonas sp. Leaf334]
MTPLAHGESAASLRRRASALRDAAARGQRIAGSLGTCLDGDVETARSAGLWYGTYARDTTAALAEQRDTVREMAEDLLADAGSWLGEAQRLEDLADEVQRAATVPAGAG